MIGPLQVDGYSLETVFVFDIKQIFSQYNLPILESKPHSIGIGPLMSFFERFRVAVTLVRSCDELANLFDAYQAATYPGQ